MAYVYFVHPGLLDLLYLLQPFRPPQSCQLIPSIHSFIHPPTTTLLLRCAPPVRRSRTAQLRAVPHLPRKKREQASSSLNRSVAVVANREKRCCIVRKYSVSWPSSVKGSSRLGTAAENQQWKPQACRSGSCKCCNLAAVVHVDCR